MGAATSRNERHGRAGAGALGLLLASGCGSTVSLDANATTTTGSSSTTGTTSAGSHTTEGSSSSEGDAPPDVPTPDVPGIPPLPPGACPAECAVELPLVWAWEERLPPAASERRVSAMVRALDGSLVVAERRDGEVWLTQVEANGSFAWTAPMSLGCDCEVVDLAIGRDGELVLLGEGSVGNGIQILVLGNYLLLGFTAPIENWMTWDIIYGTPERDPRVGSVIPLDDGGVAVLVVEVATDPLVKDWFQIYYYALGTQQSLSLVDTQLAADAPRRPRGVALPDGRLAMTLPRTSAASPGDYVLFVHPVEGGVSEIEGLPGPADVIAEGLDGAVVVAGTLWGPPAQPVLHAAGLPLADPPAWTLATEVPTSTTHAPVVAVDAEGSATVALWTPREAAVALWRLAADGTPVWSTTLPLAASDSPLPVALSLAHDGDLVLAAIVDGRLHLERREQGCRCD